MWIMTNRGMISIVAPTAADFKRATADHAVAGGAQIKDFLAVRARNADHLSTLFPGAKVITDFGVHRDYPARTFLPRSAVERLLAQEIAGLKYTNFKDSVKDHPYHDALLTVWSAMNRYGQSLLGKRKRDPRSHGSDHRRLVERQGGVWDEDRGFVFPGDFAGEIVDDMNLPNGATEATSQDLAGGAAALDRYLDRQRRNTAFVSQDEADEIAAHRPPTSAAGMGGNS